MKPIKSLIKDSLSVDFNGDTYVIDAKPVLISEDLFEHLKERYPMAIDFKFKGAKTLTKIKSTKTPVKMVTRPADAGIDMMTSNPQSPSPMFNQVDGLPESGKVDKDGVQWYGESKTEGGK